MCALNAIAPNHNHTPVPIKIGFSRYRFFNTAADTGNVNSAAISAPEIDPTANDERQCKADDAQTPDATLLTVFASFSFSGSSIKSEAGEKLPLLSSVVANQKQRTSDLPSEFTVIAGPPDRTCVKCGLNFRSNTVTTLTNAEEAR